MKKLIENNITYLVEQFYSNPSLIEEYIHEVYEVIGKVEDRVKSYITLRPLEDVLDEFRKLRDRIKYGFKGRLLGIAVAVKDCIVTRGIRTTCASRMLQDFIPPYNATVVERIINEGGIIIGKTNMDEFAMGSTTENSAFYVTRNPWDLSRVAGGSSGGSAAAVSSREASIALGSDTGGSIRTPASYTGTVGMKPTYGLVSRYGLIAYANSLEQIGPIARNLSDLTLMLSIISGHDPKDSTSLKIYDTNYDRYLSKAPLKNYKIAVIKECIEQGVDRAVMQAFNRAISRFESEGLEVTEVSMPLIKYGLPAYYIIADAEASSNLARYDGIRYGYHVGVGERSYDDVYSEVRSYGFGLEVKRRILLGTFVLSAGYYDQYYLKALKVRRLLRNEFVRIFNRYDFIAIPTTPTPPPKIGEAIDDPLKLYLMDIYTVLANLVGIPAISIPADIVDGLPIGIQILGPELSEGYLINIAYIYEEISKLRDLTPPLVV